MSAYPNPVAICTISFENSAVCFEYAGTKRYAFNFADFREKLDDCCFMGLHCFSGDFKHRNVQADDFLKDFLKKGRG